MIPDSELHTMLANYDKANRLKSWADLFGFQLEMGRDAMPYIILDGIVSYGDNPESLINYTAIQMGMSEATLNGELNKNEK